MPARNNRESMNAGFGEWSSKFQLRAHKIELNYG